MDSENASQSQAGITLIERIYKPWPEVRDQKIKEWKTLNQKHPFLKFGQWHTVLTGSSPRAMATLITDGRLPKEFAFVGFFEALDEASGQAVLDKIELLAKTQNVKVLGGPVNLTVWHSFRFATENAPSPFPTEPFNPSWYPKLWEQAGFAPIVSHLTTTSLLSQTLISEFKAHTVEKEKAGWQFTVCRLAGPLPDFHALHQLASEAFSSTWRFVPISFDEFLFQWASDGQATNICVVAAQAPSGEIAGFSVLVFSVQTMIVKTLAVGAEYRGTGLAQALLGASYQLAESARAQRVLFSTMRDDNPSILRLVGGEEYRRYVTFEKCL